MSMLRNLLAHTDVNRKVSDLSARQVELLQ